jgi:hypothetical protein
MGRTEARGSWIETGKQKELGRLRRGIGLEVGIEGLGRAEGN